MKPIKYEFKKLENLELKDILTFYDDEDEDSKDNLSDIYYYLYYYFKSGKTTGKYSDNFKAKHNNFKNIKAKQNEFKKRVKNYIIAYDKKLIKMVDIKNPITNENSKGLAVILLKERNTLLILS